MNIVDESELIIPALNGLPGPWSVPFTDCTIDPDSRWVIDHRPSGMPREDMDAANNALVLELMKGVEQPRRLV